MLICCSIVTEAIAYINGSGIIGYITFSLVEPNRVYVFVFLSGLSGECSPNTRVLDHLVYLNEFYHYSWREV